MTKSYDAGMPQTETVDPQQPSQKAMAMVKTKNKITELELQRQIEQYEKEMALSILNIDHERLDLKDFIRQIKQCDSNELPESRHWLGQRLRRQQEAQPIRVNFTSPGGGTREDQSHTAPEKIERTEDKEDVVASGRFRTQRRNSGAARLHMLYSRRAQLVDPGPIWGQTYATNPGQSDRGTRSRPSSIASSVSDVIDLSKQPSRTVRISSRIEQIDSRNNVDIVVLGDHDAVGVKSKHAWSETARHRKPGYMPQQNTDDFMKDLLVENAKERYKRKTGRPIEDKLTEFYTKLNDWKQGEERGEMSEKDTKRRYMLLAKGIRAALDDSSDEEEHNPLHTL